MVNGFHSVLKLRKSEMSNILISFILFVLIYCTLTCFHLAYKLAVMQKALETVLADNKDFDNEDLFKKGFFSGLLCFYTTYFNDKKFLETLDKN